MPKPTTLIAQGFVKSLVKGSKRLPEPATCPACGAREAHKRWCPRR